MIAPQTPGARPPFALTPVDFDPFADEPAPPAAFPLSEAQREIWAVVQMGREASCAYNLCFALRLTGAVSVEDLRVSVQHLFDRYEALRLVFDASGASQAVQPPHQVDVPVADLSSLTPAERAAALDAIFAEEVGTPLDLVNGPPARARLVVEAPDRCLLVLTAHHIVFDGWSAWIFFQELAVLYGAARRRELPVLPPAVPFSQFVLRAGHEPALEAARAFWQKRFAGAVPVLDLPLDKPRPPVKTYQGALQRVALDAALGARLRQAAGQQGSTIVGFLLAAFETLLCRLTGQADVVVGLPVSVRDVTDRPTLVGHATNLLPIRIQGDSQSTFATHLRTVRGALLDAQEHQALTFGTLVREMNLARDPSRNTLVAATFNVDRGRIAPTFVDAEASIVMPARRHLNFEIEMNVADTGAEFIVECSYNPDLLTGDTVRRWLGHYSTLLAAVVADPHTPLDRLPLLTDAERQQVLEAWNDTRAAVPDLLVHGLVEAQAARTPGRGALSAGAATWSYAELNARAARLAQVLRARGVGVGQRVGLCVERGADMVAALVGILQTGAAYVPLDPSFPAERLRFMAEDAQLALLVSTTALAGAFGLPRAQQLLLDADAATLASTPTAPLAAEGRAAQPDDPAYVIYTSGSTGKPKGVVVPHRAVVNFLASMAREPGLEASDRLVAVTTLSFDIAVLELLLPLTVGAEVILASREEAADGEALRALLAASGATMMQATPATWRLLLDAGWKGGHHFKALIGGESLAPDLADSLLARTGELWNMYGPTETTVWSTCWRVSNPAAGISIGRPIANTTVYVLDSAGQPCPIGVPGEICIGGTGVALGYLHRAELTAERFVPDPFANRSGALMYRTGDRGRWLPNGTLEHLGRLDFQVKLRGFRIELGEIETALRDEAGVEDAAVVVQETPGGDRRLVAFLALGAATDMTALRGHLKNRLPAYMLPSSVTVLDQLPRTPNGKVDRKALEQMEVDAGQRRPGSRVAPRTATEEILAGIWSHLLRLEQVGTDEDFFELGGHSLLAAQVASRVRQLLDLDLPPRELFAAPTVAGLAARIDALRSSSHTVVSGPPLVAEPYAGPTDMSFAQQRMWLLDQMGVGGAVYVIPHALRLVGPLDYEALDAAVQAVAARHESLRTTFAGFGDASMQVVAEPSSVALPVVELGGEPERLAAMMRDEAQRGFDLSNGPLFRTVLYRLGSDDHVLLFLMHHIVSDEWSVRVLVSEFGQVYRERASGRQPSLPALPVQYRNFARWQREWQQGAVLESQRAFWRGCLAGAPHVLELPTDRPRPPVESHRGATYTFLVPADVSRDVAALARREGVTVFMTLLAAFEVLLWRYTGQEDLLVGCPMTHRSRAELEELIGLFVNELVLRANLSGDPSVRELLGRVRESCLHAYAHQDLPFEHLVRELRPDRDLSRNPLFQVMFVLLHQAFGSLELPGLSVSPVEVDRGTSQMDLTLFVQETPEGLRGAVEYATDLFDEATIRQMAVHWQSVLAGMARSPEQRVSQLPLLTDAERHQQLVAWNQTGMDISGDLRIHRLVESQVTRTPTETAVVFRGERCSFEDLNARANRLARHLRLLGVGPEIPVGICMERSLDMIVSMLGVLKAGGAYVPLDPAYPRDRVAFMLEDSRAAVLLTQDSLREFVPAAGATRVCVDTERDAIGLLEGSDLPDGVTAANLAYVIYTSGSTGVPKGVAIEHRSAATLLHWGGTVFSPQDRSGLLASTSICFDLSVFEIFLPLAWGGRVILAENALELPDLPARSEVTLVNTVPSAGTELVRTGALPPSVRTVCLAGEPLPTRLVDELYATGHVERVYDLYGPSEDTTYSTCALREAGAPPTIGRPIACTQAYVLDPRLEPVPIGVVGELYLSGDGLARGYLHRPELTAERFVHNPFSASHGGRMYRTGDLVRYRRDGNLIFLGRIDHQVKLRGFRIELGEIEAALRSHEAVNHAIAVVRGKGPDAARLVAYVVFHPGALATGSELRRFLRATLPEYMLPNIFVELDELPLTPSGKIDRKALPPPGDEERDAEQTVIEPRTETERVLAETWREILGVQRISVRDNFFELGGHSLLAAQMITRVQQRAGHRLGLRAVIFETLEQIAAGVEPR